jgi:hypothetical protein
MSTPLCFLHQDKIPSIYMRYAYILNRARRFGHLLPFPHGLDGAIKAASPIGRLIPAPLSVKILPPGIRQPFQALLVCLARTLRRCRQHEHETEAGL